MMVWISALILFTYIGIYLWREGIPYCLSETYYKWGWLFSAMIWATGWLIVPAAMEHGPGPIPLFSVFGILLVGAAPNFKREEIPHKVGAYTGLIGAQIMAIVGCPWALLLWIAPLLLLGFTKKENLDKVGFILWCELTCYLIIYVVLLV